VCKFRTVGRLVNTALYKASKTVHNGYTIFQIQSPSLSPLKVQKRTGVRIQGSTVGLLRSQREAQRLCCLKSWSLLALPCLLPFAWCLFKSKEHHRIKAKICPWLYSSLIWLIVKINWSDLKKKYQFSRTTSWLFGLSGPSKWYC